MLLHWKSWERVLVAGGLVLVAQACGRGDDEKADEGTGTDTDAMPPEVETTELGVTVTFGSEMMKTVTNSLHVWVLRPKGDTPLSLLRSNHQHLCGTLSVWRAVPDRRGV
jgi:hypothetical protein